MNDSRYRWILYVIVFVILGTIGIQVFWNYKNYLINKQQFVNEVQISLDNAVETYFANLAEETSVRWAFRRDFEEDFLVGNESADSILHRFEFKKTPDSINIEIVDGTTTYHGIKGDTIFDVIQKQDSSINRHSNKVLIKGLSRFKPDSSSQRDLELLTSKVIVSLANDTLLLSQIDTLLKAELNRKNLNINYGLSFKDPVDNIPYINKHTIESTSLSTVSKSTYLPNNSALKVYFANETKVILKRILSGILVSIILVLAVISCLFYLLKIIRHQKQLSEVKNDLISNITHEFKTPIATIGVALESIKDFKVIDDKEKTKKYLNMSSDQLGKLNVMVEKLLETATLDSDSLKLIKEKCNIIDLLNNVVEKHQMQTEAKTIIFKSTSKEVMASIDVFHFENAINNVIDNAIKYGGDEIFVNLKQNAKTVEVSISDNGNTLTKANKDKIFEQFYRIPKGNTHNVKGFGIGLYYTKKVIEKHGGTIHLELNNKLATFKISFPNE